LRFSHPPAGENPPTERVFDDAWDELEYLQGKADYWLHHRRRAREAARFAWRMSPILHKLRKWSTIILYRECRGLVYEARGAVARAIHSYFKTMAQLKKAIVIMHGNVPVDYNLRQGRQLVWNDATRQGQRVCSALVRLLVGAGRSSEASGFVQAMHKFCRENEVDWQVDRLTDSLRGQQPSSRSSGGSRRVRVREPRGKPARQPRHPR
jgi:hypothetical protein